MQWENNIIIKLRQKHKWENGGKNICVLCSYWIRDKLKIKEKEVEWG